MPTLTLGHDTASDIFPGYAKWLGGLPNTQSTARSYVANRMPLETPKVVDCIAHCLYLLHERDTKSNTVAQLAIPVPARKHVGYP